MERPKELRHSMTFAAALAAAFATPMFAPRHEYYGRGHRRVRTNYSGSRPVPGGGAQERARRQIEAGQLKAENGLVVE